MPGDCELWRRGAQWLLGAGCELPPHPTVPHVQLPAHSCGHHSAAGSSHQLRPSELQKTKISISLILIFPAMDFCTVLAQGHAGRSRSGTIHLSSQPQDMPLSRSLLLLQGGIWPKGPRSSHWGCCLGQFKNCFLKKKSHIVQAGRLVSNDLG